MGLIHKRTNLLLGIGNTSFIIHYKEFKRFKRNIVIMALLLYGHCLVLIGSKNGFERDFNIELK